MNFWVTDFCEIETVAVLKDTTGEIGCNKEVWYGNNSEGTQVKNGAYFINYQTNDVVGKRLIFSFDTNIDSSNGNAVTDEDGTFSISQSCLPTGYSSEYITVSRNVKIIASHSSFDTIILDNIFIDPNSGADVTIQFE